MIKTTALLEKIHKRAVTELIFQFVNSVTFQIRVSSISWGIAFKQCQWHLEGM